MLLRILPSCNIPPSRISHFWLLVCLACTVPYLLSDPVILSVRVLLNGNSGQPTSPPPPSRHAQRSPRLTAIPGIDHNTCRPGRERGFKAKSKRKRCVLCPRVVRRALLRFLDSVFAQGEHSANCLVRLQLANSYNELLEYVLSSLMFSVA